MRRDAKVDANQPEIVAALKKVGATIWHTYPLGRGGPDIVVGYGGRSYPMEIKSKDGVLTEDEVKWHKAWQGNISIVRSVDEALEVIGIGIGRELYWQPR